MMISFLSSTESETIAFAQKVAQSLSAGAIVCLYGNLGAGKTHFCKGLALHFGIKPEAVHSPTFALIHEYSGTLPMYHIDAYRLTSVSEALDIGMEEYFYGEGITVIEWPERIESILPEERIEVHFTFLEESKRNIEVTFPSENHERIIIPTMG